LIEKKWANQSSKQASKQDFDSMTTPAQRAAVVKTLENLLSRDNPHIIGINRRVKNVQKMPSFGASSKLL